MTIDLALPRVPGLAIHWRPSGGRGEYELTGIDLDSNVRARELVGFAIEIATPFGIKQSNTYISASSGKLRLRLVSQVRGGHLPSRLAAMLLLPDVVRDERKLSRSLPVVLAKRYAADINLHLDELEDGAALLRPTEFVARSADIGRIDRQQVFNFEERSQDIKRLYEARDNLPRSLSGLLEEHQGLVNDIKFADELNDCVSLVMGALVDFDEVYVPTGDPLDALLALAGVAQSVAVPIPSETPADSPHIRRRVEHIYRLQKSRGADSVRFKKSVRLAYRDSCAFCGFSAPASPGLVSGTDAAHILPWGEYELDVVENGILLCKFHHWAFDNRMLRLDYSGNGYFISLGSGAHEAFSGDPHSLSKVSECCGVVDPSRLPSKKSQMPSSEFLRIFNEGE